MNIVSLNANIENTTITVNGTAEAGVLAAQIVVYDKNGENIIVMQSAAVNADNTFTATIAVPTNAEYQVKAADYDGGTFMTVMTTEAAAEEGSATDETETETSPAAGTPETGFQTITHIEDNSATAEANASSSVAIFAVAAAILLAVAVTTVIIRARKRQR